MKIGIFRFLLADIIVIIHYFGIVSSFGLGNFFNFAVSPDPLPETSNDVNLGHSSEAYAADSVSYEPSSSYMEHSYVNTEPTVTICSRVPKYINIGRDATGTEYETDIGQCLHMTIPTAHIDTRAFGEICDVTLPCETNRNRSETNSLLAGMGRNSKYDVIEECTCRKAHHKCGRHSLFKTFFPNSPYETTLDVGTCSGECNKDDSDGCFPTRKVTKSVLGPNGDECAEIVAECSCAHNCHRESWFETYYTQTWDDATNSTVTTKLIFDVGKCTGTCEQEPFCLVRDRVTGKCTSSLNVPATCSRSSFTKHAFTTTDGYERIVLTSAECVCA